MARKRMTFDEMRNEGREPSNGLLCPKCGAGHLERYGGETLQTGTIRRYRICRNPNCRARWVTSQPPERATREVESTKVDDDDRPVLKVRTA